VAPKQIESLGFENSLCRGRWTRRYQGVRRASASDTALPATPDCCHVSSFKCEPLISNGHLNINVLGQEASDASCATHQTLLSHTGRYSETHQTRLTACHQTRLSVRRTLSENLAHDPADVTHWTLNSVPAVFGARALDAPVTH